ncbi:MAG: NYN domain-containing protein [Cyanophyceae cyanobacterium]
MHAPRLQTLLLVDGYNIIGAWPHLEKVRDRHGLEPARQDLVECLINYSARKDFQIQVVFDAHYQNSPSHQEVYTDKLLAHYTAWLQTADTYIEKFCAVQRDSSSRLIVATSDRAQQLTVIGYGAEWMSAQQLKSDVALVERQSRRRHRPQKSQGRFLFHSLDAQAQQRLEEWRQGIY